MADENRWHARGIIRWGVEMECYLAMVTTMTMMIADGARSGAVVLATGSKEPAHDAALPSWVNSFAAERKKAADFLRGRFNPKMGLLKGVWAGGHG